jgi:hypothetical protein
MNKLLVSFCIALAVANAANASTPSTKPQVSVEHVFDMPADAVWKQLGRFCSISQWQSLVASCLTEERADGFYRVVVMKDHTAFTERLERYSHEERSFRYSILQGPLAVKGYVCDFQILPLDNGRSRLVWRSWYETPASVNGAEVAKTIEGLYRNGIKGMTALLQAQR